VPGGKKGSSHDRNASQSIIATSGPIILSGEGGRGIQAMSYGFSVNYNGGSVSEIEFHYIYPHFLVNGLNCFAHNTLPVGGLFGLLIAEVCTGKTAFSTHSNSLILFSVMGLSNYEV
jgi:hypothetical protein